MKSYTLRPETFTLKLNFNFTLSGILAMARRHGEVKGALRRARAALGAAEAKQRVDGAELEQLRGSWSDIEKAQEMIAYVDELSV